MLATKRAQAKYFAIRTEKKSDLSSWIGMPQTEQPTPRQFVNQQSRREQLEPQRQPTMNTWSLEPVSAKALHFRTTIKSLRNVVIPYLTGRIPKEYAMQKQAQSILIVDDDKAIREIIGRILQKQGYNVTAIGTAREAIERIMQQPFDLAIVDLGLSDTDGHEVLKMIGMHRPGTKRIILTGTPPIGEHLRDSEKDADAYLLKPLRSEELIRVIKEQLQTKVS